MNIFLDPNVAYLLLVGGFILAILALFSPGTGLLEIGALFALLLAGISIYNLPINFWALVLLILGVFPLLLALRRSRQWVFLALSLAALIVGSVFLFRREGGGVAIHPLLASVVSLTAIGLFWWIGRTGLEAIRLGPSHNLDQLIGTVYQATSDIAQEGTLYAAGEEWSAYSEKFIPAGSQVRVIRREGLVLIVEPLEPSAAGHTKG